MSLKIKILDIGLGTSTLIETDEINIIFDCGNNSETGNNAFRELGNKTLHYLILTHPHKDHIESLISRYYTDPEQIKKNENIPDYLINKQIINAQNEHDKKIFQKYKQINDRFTRTVPNENSYNHPKNNGGITIEHFIPSEQTSDDLNDYSIATLLDYKGLKILLMGDNTQKNIKELMNHDNNKNKIKKIDVLLAPHHGRESCYVPEFVKHLNPKITIISDSPEIANESALSKYEYYTRGMAIMKNGKYESRKCLTTRNDGDITLTITDNGNLSISCSK